MRKLGNLWEKGLVRKRREQAVLNNNMQPGRQWPSFGEVVSFHRGKSSCIIFFDILGVFDFERGSNQPIFVSSVVH